MGVHRRPADEQRRDTSGDAARRRLERTGIRPIALLQDHLPAELQASVVTPGRKGFAGMVLIVVLGVAAAWIGVWFARPGEASAPRSRPPLGRPLSGATTSAPHLAPAPAGAHGHDSSFPSSGPYLLVHVVGAVHGPGLVSLAPGSRVDDAVTAAGGMTARADPASVNLARPLVDGEQLVVGRRGRAAAASAEAGATPAPYPGSPAPAGRVNLNTATLDQLDDLPGIGPVLAQRILDWRQAHGRFSSVDELGEVSGIGEATLADLRAVVTL